MKKNIILVLLIIFMCIPVAVMAVPSAPPGEPNGEPSSSQTSVSYNGTTIVSVDTNESGKTYTSFNGGENALLVSGGISTITSPNVAKTGDSSGDEADFYGTNAAVLVYNGATLNINGGTVTTNGSHANGIFAYGTGIINISDSTINTLADNSGGIMVTGGGNLTASNLTIKTTGNSSAAIRSDRGGGVITVDGGNYETNGVGSPSVYSTADITVNNASLISTKSEGVVVEGANSVTLNNTTLTDTNTTLNGNSETYKNIFLYQSMSGDADAGTALFTSKNSNITTDKGDTMFVTNTTAIITLENNTFTNNDGDFLRIQKGKWGNSGSNGGNVTLNLTNQNVEGNIIVDNISTLNIKMDNSSTFTGAIDTENQAKEISITLSSDSTITLTNDTYIDSLTNEDSTNSNINLNSHKLYVNGTQINKIPNNSTTTSLDTMTTVIGVILGILALVVIILIIRKRKNR